MTLEAPNLDSRTFTDLVKEARERIPRFTPDWTNLNDADPGMTLIKLQAWLTETLLYEVNRLPELNYIKFLQLLNVTAKPAEAAKTELHFTLKKLDRLSDPLTLFIPKNAQIEADDPDLSTPVIFETDQTLTALNATVAAVITTNNNDNILPKSLVSAFDAKKVVTTMNNSFYPFGSEPVNGAVCFIGILLRPHRKEGEDYSQDIFPAGELDLAVNSVEVFDENPDGQRIEGPLGTQCLLPFEMTEKQGSLVWEVCVGSQPGEAFTETQVNSDVWEILRPSMDETAALSRSGHLRPVLPEDISQVSLHDLPRAFWEEMGLKKPPTNGQELVDDLEDSDLGYDADNVKDIAWESIVLADALAAVTGCCEGPLALAAMLKPILSSLSFNEIKRQDWIDLDVGYGDPQVPSQAMAWLRVRLVDNVEYQPVPLNGFFLNTVSATAVVTRLEEPLGHSDGRPSQTYQVAKTPVYFSAESGEPDIAIYVVEAGKPETWSRVTDFFATNRDSTVYSLDESTGVITFGDGIYGRIPVAGSNIVVKRYRYGGGDQGNVGANTVSKIKTSLAQVDSVTNPRQASGGRAVETIEHAKLRAPHDLKVRDRAVTAEDFAFLAKQTPGVPVHTAYALARKGLSPIDQSIIDVNGAVTVVILPTNNKQDTPQPSEAQLDAVCKYLNSKRLITTELYVTGPRYTSFELFEVEIRAHQNADLKAVSDAIYESLLSYFHPLNGGDEGNGWPFGEDIYLGSIYARLLDVPDVKRVIGLNVALKGDDVAICQDTITLDAGHLLHLTADVINLKVVYDNR